MNDEWDTGAGTSTGMWQMVSELLRGEKLPQSVSLALLGLCAGELRLYPPYQTPPWVAAFLNRRYKVVEEMKSAAKLMEAGIPIRSSSILYDWARRLEVEDEKEACPLAGSVHEELPAVRGDEQAKESGVSTGPVPPIRPV